MRTHVLRGRVAVPIALTSAAVLALGVGRGCGSGSSAADPDTDSASVIHPGDAGDASTDGDGAVVDDGGTVGPTGAPDGWAPFTGYDPACAFYTPRSAENLPPPLAWVACPAGLVTNGIACRQIQPNWGANGTISPSMAATVKADGTVALELGLFFGNGFAYAVVADVDGPVHLAILRTNSVCVISDGDLYGGKVAFRVLDSELDNSLGKSAGGAIGGGIDEPPKVLLHFHDTTRRTYPAGPNSFLEDSVAGSLAHSWLNPAAPTTTTTARC